MPTLGFNGINNAMTITGSEVAFDKWDEMSAFIVFEGVTLGNWDMILRKRTETGGWYFGSGHSLRAYFYVAGTSANNTQSSAHGANWNNAQIITLQFGKGYPKWYFNGEEKMTVNDLGTMASSSDAPLVIGAHLQASGNDTSEAPMNLSEVLIFRNRLALPDQRKIEGYLAHKWDLNSSLDASHPYRAAIPTFNDSISVDLTLYWGPNDGGTNAAIWENNVSLGRYYAEERINGFSAKAYEIPASLDKTQAAKDYFADINQLLALTPSGSAIIQGDPGNPSGTACTLMVMLTFSFLKWESMWEHTDLCWYLKLTSLLLPRVVTLLGAMLLMINQCCGSTLIKMENMSVSEKRARNAYRYLHCPVT